MWCEAAGLPLTLGLRAGRRRAGTAGSEKDKSNERSKMRVESAAERRWGATSAERPIPLGEQCEAVLLLVREACESHPAVGVDPAVRSALRQLNRALGEDASR